MKKTNKTGQLARSLQADIDNDFGTGTDLAKAMSQLFLQGKVVRTEDRRYVLTENLS